MKPTYKAPPPILFPISVWFCLYLPSSLTPFLSLSLYFALSSLSVCLLQPCGHIHTLYSEDIYHMQKTHRKGSLLWDPAHTLDPLCVLCMSLIVGGGGQWEGSREGGSKLNVLQKTWGHNSLLSFFFALNHTHFSSLLFLHLFLPPKPIASPPQTKFPLIGIPSPDISILWGGLAVLRKGKS